MALYILKEKETWAVKSLRAAGYAVTMVHRVYPATDDSDVECLYLDGQGDPRTAYLQPDGLVLATRPGF